MKPDRREAGREEIPPAQAPQHGSRKTGRETGREENRRSPLLARRPSLQDLVDRAAGETLPRKVSVEGGDPEGQRLPRLRRRPLQPCDPRP